jgi:formylglycine-generating enzyme required for sulfatase activity
VRRAAIKGVWGALLALCGCSGVLPPLPEIVVVADTDLPVPLAVTSLRVDLYTAEGAWFESADIARPDPRDWPVSFSVYSDDPARARLVWVRLRAYLDGRTRDYLGENPFTPGGPVDEGAPASDAPRLIQDGHDATPPSEPDPLAAVDRLVLLALQPDERRKAAVVLHGACAGTSAIFGSDPATLVAGEAATCVDAEGTRVPVAATAGEPDDGARGPSVRGSWLAGSCPPDGGGERVCVPGGATILGSSDSVSSGLVSARPVRLLGVRRFHLDRREVTVGRFREALAGGLETTDPPYANDGPLGTGSIFESCTWSSQPMGREDYALGCVSWFTARAFCRFAGGDLPTEAQWEHAATVAGHASKTHYPWGDGPPDCDLEAYGGVDDGTGLPTCPGKGPLPRPPEASAGDLSPLGIVALGGGVSEWVLDAAAPYADACWGDAPIVDPRCGDPDQPASMRGVRGANYSLPMTFSTARLSMDPARQSIFTGLRCAYPDGAP